MNPMRLHHLGVAVPNIEAAIPIYEKLFGYGLVSGPFDDPIQKVKVCFLRAGDLNDSLVELIEPLGADSPVNKYLAKEAGAYHLCYETDALDEKLAEMRAARCILLSKPVPAVAFEGRRIAWVYTPIRQLIELLER